MKIITLIITLFVAQTVAHANGLKDKLAAIESEISGQIGVSVYDVYQGPLFNYNGDKRFPLMSTFKTIACAKMLRDADNDKLKKSKLVPVYKSELVDWSPITKTLINQSISLEKSCEATMITSDNTAANIILNNIGGPEAVTSFLREIGDQTTRLDRLETELNEAKPGDVRDTTTPNAITKTLHALLFTNALSSVSKSELKNWMVKNEVSNSLLRSVLPKGWFIADRSGAGGYGSRAITAVIWSEQQSPKILAIYITNTKLAFKDRNRVIAQIGKYLFNEFDIQ